MRVNTLTSGNKLHIVLRLDREDDLHASGQQGMPIELVTDSATIELDDTAAAIHPDLIALSVLTIVAPWARRRVTLDEGISPEFSKAAMETLGIEVGPVDDFLSARPQGTRLGLMYSGGPDCMAAEVLLDDNMPRFHFRRVKHSRVPNRATRFHAEVQEAIVRRSQARGEELHVARSDLEYLCRPFPTFPHWVALTVGAILLAGDHDLGSVVTGRNISGIYLGWGKEYTADGEQESRWEALFAAAGLRLLNPLAGASDVLSKRIALNHPHHDLARSCVAGTIDAPCYRCKKCLMTELTRAAMKGEPLDESVVASLSSNPMVTRRFDRPPPYPNQHLVAYSLARVPGIDATFLRTAKAALTPGVEETAWMERYYRPALAQRLPPDIAERVSSRLATLADFMSSDEEKIVEGWSVSD